MRTKPIAFSQGVGCSDEAYTNWLHTLRVNYINLDYINLEKFLKDEELLTEIETISPFESWDIYHPLKNDNISNIKVYHNTNTIKGISEKIIHDSFVYAEDYKIKKIEITSNNYYEFKKRNEILFDSDEINNILTATDIAYKQNINSNEFVKTIPIDKTTTFADVKKGLDGFITLTTFVNTCIDEIEKPARDIIQNNYEKLLTKKT